MHRSQRSARARPRRLAETTSRRRACPAALLILVLYLMYRESGDKELMFILGGMLFL